MSDAVAGGRDSRHFVLAHHTRRKLSGLPLPIGDRVGVREFGSIERPEPLTPPLSLWEREQTESASRQT
jgi:hypothetical protein